MKIPTFDFLIADFSVISHFHSKSFLSHEQAF